MQQVRSFLPFLLYSNLIVGGIAVSVVLGTYALLGLAPSGPLLLLAFCGTFLVYQFERALLPAPEDSFNQPERLAWVGDHRGYVWVSSMLALVGGVAALPWLRVETLLAGGGLALLSGLYRLPITLRRRRLKEVWYLKPLAITGAWAVGGVVLPALEAGVSVSVGLLALTAYRMLFILPNTLLADWPDRGGDAKAGLSTAAIRFKGAQLRWMSALSLGMACVGGGGVLLMYPSLWLLAVDLLGPVLMLVLVLRPWPRARWFYGLVLDLVVAWPLVTATAAWGA